MISIHYSVPKLTKMLFYPIKQEFVINMKVRVLN